MTLLEIHCAMKLRELLLYAELHNLDPETEVLCLDEAGDPCPAAITDPSEFDPDDPCRPTGDFILIEPEQR